MRYGSEVVTIFEKQKQYVCRNGEVVTCINIKPKNQYYPVIFKTKRGAYLWTDATGVPHPSTGAGWRVCGEYRQLVAPVTRLQYA